MGKLWSRLFTEHDSEGNDSDSSLCDSDDSTEFESTGENENESKSPKIRRRKAKKEEPTDGWEEICGIAIDVLEDVMLTKKHKIRHSSKYISERDIKVPTIEENCERLSNAYNLWLKYRPDNCLVFMPKWEQILEKPILEQSVLVDEYVKKVFYLLELEEIPEYNIPDDIPKGEVFIRNPNRPGTFIKIADALELAKQPSKIQDRSSCKELFSNIPSSSRIKGDESNTNLKLINKNHSHHTI